jgi:hypothetical protein
LDKTGKSNNDSIIKSKTSDFALWYKLLDRI